MKSTALIFLLAIALSSTALAGEKAKKTKPATAQRPKASQTQVTAPHEEKDVALTGSYVKRDVRRNGIVTDGPHVVYVLDNDAIRNSGATTVAELLTRRGVHR